MPAVSGCPTRTRRGRTGRSSAPRSSCAGPNTTGCRSRKPGATRPAPTSRALPDLVLVGRVGRPHGLGGAFFVEEASEDPDRFTVGSNLLVDGEEAEVVESKRA